MRTQKHLVWADRGQPWTTIPDSEVKDAVERLLERCQDLIGSEVADVTCRTAMTNRLCSARRSWQQRQKRRPEAGAIDSSSRVFNVFNIAESPGAEMQDPMQVAISYFDACQVENKGELRLANVNTHR